MLSIRKLTKKENPLLEEHLLRVGGEDRVMRFMGGVNDDFIRAHCSLVGGPSSVVIGCFVDGTLRGASELWFEDDGDRRCELALSVEHDFQGQGIGTELLRRSLVLARNRNAKSIYIACLPENRKMRHLLRKFGRIVTRLDSGTLEAELALPARSHLSLWQEFAGDGIGMMDALVERITHTGASEHRAAA
ncbi:GNAT family N-acetyltransferase [Oricola thermophila]|uniref:GNAT family N-acetyltransferase n=1 Tax=Oricola thermophila TaxID=2742145 RepID=A0A6N1VAE8_9HYPH|nr:GNAT family N-acetyltransferase [Oricola thermophila]QKV17523.1 GNAT family N-acetyltransferase [Oricola thermophila]